ncbi:MAG: hypothetical protein WBE34_05865 [Candidatus Nitrosopolaris sp.]
MQSGDLDNLSFDSSPLAKTGNCHTKFHNGPVSGGSSSNTNISAIFEFTLLKYEVITSTLKLTTVIAKRDQIIKIQISVPLPIFTINPQLISGRNVPFIKRHFSEYM